MAMDLFHVRVPPWMVEQQPSQLQRLPKASSSAHVAYKPPSMFSPPPNPSPLGSAFTNT
jgi:hypothetical protein